MFQAGVAALIKNGFALPDKKIGHDWLQASFSEQLIQRRKIFSAKFRSFLPAAYRARALADYEPSSISKKIANSELKNAKEFVHAINLEVSNDAQS